MRLAPKGCSAAPELEKSGKELEREEKISGKERTTERNPAGLKNRKRRKGLLALLLLGKKEKDSKAIRKGKKKKGWERDWE